jgi:hypothetical protein
MQRSWVFLIGALLSIASGAVSAAGAMIQYEAVDLPDTVPGEDLWQYHYTVSGYSLLAGQGFDVFFAVADGFQFGDLVDPQTGPSSDWDVLAIQADPGLPADGLFDVVALVDDPAPGATFVSTFIWRGTGAPGAQHFELFDEQFAITESGTTTPLTVAPEPTLFGLAVIGLLAIGASRQTSA